MRSLSLLQAPAAPQPAPRQRLVQNLAQFESGSMPEPLYNPYPHLPSLDPLGAVLDSTFTPFYSWEGMNLSSYPDITVESASPQPPAASSIDIPPQTFFQTSYQWTAEDLELLSNLPPLALPSQYSNPAPEAGSNLDLAHSPSFQRTPFSNGQYYVDVLNPTHLTSNPLPHAVSFDGAYRPLLTAQVLMAVMQTYLSACHKARARYDAPKCDEDTRVEVTRELMEWIEDYGGPQRLLCMTGAAGSGKSALQQTIAERCAEDNILGAAYFISAGDPSRNTTSTIIPTIAYQLGLKHPILQRSIASAVKHDPFIFSQSLKTQMDVLVVRPFESLRRSEEYDISTFPHAILIDGLDECQAEPDTTTDLGHVKMKYRAEDRQAELLSAIRNSLLNNNLPFRIFIASRPELPIRTALSPTGSLHGLAYHIQLSDQYDATEDMRRYLRRRFQDISFRIGQPDWFAEDDIETLVQAGSGQFVYVATVFKYVSEPRASPVHRLKTVLDWTPDQGQVTKPFEALDMLYTSILLNAKEAYEAVDTHSGRDFLLLFKIFHMHSRGAIGFQDERSSTYILNALLGLESNALDILTLDLHSLVYLGSNKNNKLGNMWLTEYHKSLIDFMNEESRAKDLFVPCSCINTHLAKCCMQYIIKSPELPSLPDEWEDVPVSEQCLIEAIAELNFLLDTFAVDDEIVDFTHHGGWHKIDMVLSKLSRINIIFLDEESASDWACRLGHTADDLKKHRPEAAAIMSQYAEKWELHFKKRENESCTDTSSGSGNEFSEPE
ncbi:hypothetical protein H1R20_g1310, partial [Candolleomyces eurysporus]